MTAGVGRPTPSVTNTNGRVESPTNGSRALPSQNGAKMSQKSPSIPADRNRENGNSQPVSVYVYLEALSNHSHSGLLPAQARALQVEEK